MNWFSFGMLFVRLQFNIKVTFKYENILQYFNIIILLYQTEIHVTQHKILTFRSINVWFVESHRCIDYRYVIPGLKTGPGAVLNVYTLGYIHVLRDKHKLFILWYKIYYLIVFCWHVTLTDTLDSLENKKLTGYHTMP